MSEERINWEQLYRDEFTPWDVKRPDSHLAQIIATTPIKPCRTLELGCGTGTNAIWLARQGFKVTAIDMSETALALAKKKDGADACTLLLADFFKDPLPGTDFGFVFDLGCFHGFGKPEERDLFASRVAGCLVDDGYWLSIISSTDGPAVVPTRLSARDVTSAVEPYFEIVSLTATLLDDLSPEDRAKMGIEGGPRPQAWACFMRKREPEAE